MAFNNITENSWPLFLEVVFFFPTANQKEIIRERIIVLSDALKIALHLYPGETCVIDDTVIKSVIVMQFCSGTCTCKLIRLWC